MLRDTLLFLCTLYVVQKNLPRHEQTNATAHYYLYYYYFYYYHENVMH